MFLGSFKLLFICPDSSKVPSPRLLLHSGQHHTKDSEPMSTINFSQVVQAMLSVSDKISDLIFSPGRPPQVELIGKLSPVNLPGMEMLTPAHTAGIAKAFFFSSRRRHTRFDCDWSSDVCSSD